MCGAVPAYYVGDVIRDESKLLVANGTLFEERFNIGVRTRNEVLAIDRVQREIEVRDLPTGRAYREHYDALVLRRPCVRLCPGWNARGIFVLRTIPDSRKIREWIQQKNARSAVVVGAGFIGLEMAENLAHRGLSVVVVEMLNQVMPPFDPEMARPVQEHLEQKGLQVALGEAVASFESVDSGIVVRTTSGAKFVGDIVILAIGVGRRTVWRRRPVSRSVNAEASGSTSRCAPATLTFGSGRYGRGKGRCHR